MEIKNKKAYFDYFILKELEAGISLTGTPTQRYLSFQTGLRTRKAGTLIRHFWMSPMR